MLQNYLKITIRSLLRNKTQTSILIGGLTAGMAACILLLQYVGFELSFDHFHSKKDQIYRVVNERLQNGESVQKGTITYPTIGRAMKEEYAEIKNATRLAYSSDVMITHENKVNPVEPGLWADEHFFQIFDFTLLAQNDLKVLDEPNELVLSQSLAERYFPDSEDNYELVLGKELTIDTYQEPFKIVGVCEDIPKNSLLQFDLLISYASATRYWGEGADNSWTWSDFYHFIEVEKGTDIGVLEAKFIDFSERHFRGTEVSGSQEIFTLQPLTDAHLYSQDLEYEIGQTTNGRSVWSLLIIAFFILLIAWINYVNLSSVKAIERAKEVGVRKVLGATKGQLMRQFLTEALTLNLISFSLALGLVQILSPWLQNSVGIQASGFTFFAANSVGILILFGFIALILLGVLISGIYPAWLLSSSQVSSVLKNIFTKNIGGANLRKGLVIFQFTVSIALITVTWIVSQQIEYMSNQDLGVDIEQIMTVNSPEMSQWDSTFIDRMNTFKTELTKFPGIQSATTSSRSPGMGTGRIFQMKKLGENASDQSFTSNFINADFEYAKTYGLEPLAGRFFRETDHSTDWNDLDKIVITEATARMLGFQNDEEIIHQKVSFWDKTWTVIGVLPDFHQVSLHHQIEPIIFIPTYSTGNLLSLRISIENIDQIIAQVERSYHDFFPGNTFEYHFLNDFFQRQYEADSNFKTILSYFTLFTILIACLGLFGLASYTTFLRTKEIGVRKVLGATTAGIVVLLSKDFLKLVFGALIFAIPIAFIVSSNYLQGFAFQVAVSWWVFLLAGLAAVGIAFITVSFQSIKAALTNPIESLRSE
jgi:putative ABC transport system permease protein